MFTRLNCSVIASGSGNCSVSRCSSPPSLFFSLSGGTVNCQRELRKRTHVVAATFELGQHTQTHTHKRSAERRCQRQQQLRQRGQLEQQIEKEIRCRGWECVVVIRVIIFSITWQSNWPDSQPQIQIQIQMQMRMQMEIQL